MKKELIGIFVCMLFIFSMIPTVSGIAFEKKIEVGKSDKLIIIQTGYIFGLIENHGEEFFINKWYYNLTAKFVIAREFAMSIAPSFSFYTYRYLYKNEEIKIRKEIFFGIITDNIICGVAFDLFTKEIANPISDIIINTSYQI